MSACLSRLLCFAAFCALLAAPSAGAQPRARPAHDAARPRSDDAELPVLPKEDPAVDAVLATNPQTPEECARVAKILADLNRPDLAKGFLKKVLDAKLDGAKLVALAERFGTPMFIALANRPDVQPEGRQLGDAVLQALEKSLAEPRRLADLIGQLKSPVDATKVKAIESLLQARGGAVGPLLAVLADPARGDEQAVAKAVLMRLSTDAIRPLLAALEAKDGRTGAAAAEALASLDARAAIDWLVAAYALADTPAQTRTAAGAALVKLTGHLPAPAESAKLLFNMAREYYDQGRPLTHDLDGPVILWSWNDAQKTAEPHAVPVDQARRFLSARFAREAHQILPDDHEMLRLYLTTMLEKAAFENGLDQPLPSGVGSPAAEAAAFGPEVLDDVLVYAMHGGHSVAAAALARLLGDQPAAVDSLYREARPAPLVEATRQPDRRLRLAAAEAIVRLKPDRPFAGSNHVTECLAHFVSTRGQRKALVADPSTEEARRVGGYLVSLGYQVDTAASGRELVQLAIGSPDYELALVAASLNQPTLDFALQQLRRDCRTALLPVGVLAREGQQDRAEHLVEGDRLAMALARPHRKRDVAWMVGQLTALPGPGMVPFAERQQESAAALAMLVELSGPEQRVFDLRPYEPAILSAQAVPSLSAAAIVALGRLGTPRSQTALVDQASRTSLPLPTRRAALAAFGESIRKHGILLTTDQVARQYERYNQSEKLDPATQKILGLVLDDLESLTAGQKRIADGPRSRLDEGRPPPKPGRSTGKTGATD